MFFPIFMGAPKGKIGFLYIVGLLIFSFWLCFFLFKTYIDEGNSHQ
jgi:hypothetical protein